jgi:hypothetical protein
MIISQKVKEFVIMPLIIMSLILVVLFVGSFYDKHVINRVSNRSFDPLVLSQMAKAHRGDILLMKDGSVQAIIISPYVSMSTDIKVVASYMIVTSPVMGGHETMMLGDVAVSVNRAISSKDPDYAHYALVYFLQGNEGR